MNNYVRVVDGVVVETVQSDKPIEQIFHPSAGFLCATDDVEVGYLYVDEQFAPPKPSDAHDWDGKKWVLNKTKQAELSAQAEQQAVDAVKHALQAHIDAVAAGLGFSGGNAVMLYAGFSNAFQPLAQAFGAWEADIWAAANKYMAQVKAGEAPMLTPEQAVERIPAFEFTGV